MSAHEPREVGVLTIGQLAKHLGVTTRTIRHYHEQGLLPEPARDASGYRRYGTTAVADLIRIKALAEGGVPLSRVRELLAAEPGEFAKALADIDNALQERISELEQRRRQLATLAAGDRLVLPVEVVELLELLMSFGVSERTVQLERDGWTLLIALMPGEVPRWARDKTAALLKPEFQMMYLAWEAAYDWDPDDPRLIDLAAENAEWFASQPDAPEPAPSSELDAIYALLAAQLASVSPAWRRLDELFRKFATSREDGPRKELARWRNGD